ncbi:vitamin K epoxide reductase family protein [Candidatus Kaiserbacteria bacterium]|nr:vitamin K epoxide reductase family protein [Candidatus Kaiserbacteria bacterium]
MTPSNQSSTQPSLQAPARNSLVMRLLTAIVGVSFIGFVDSAYLLADHYFKLPLPCSVTNGCEAVLTSPYAMVGPIPLAFFGVVYYIVVIFFALYLYTEASISRTQILMMFALTLVGFLMSIVFMSIQTFLIGAICMYCALSALCTLVSFGLGTTLARIK